MEQSSIPPPNTSLFQLNLDAANSYTLRSAASWAKVLAIVGLICGILFVALGFLVKNAASGTTGGRYNDDFGGYNSSVATYGLAVYVVMGLVLIISSIFALNFGNKITRALRANDQNSLNGGFSAVRNYFAFWAILTILFLLLIIIAAAGLAMNSGGR